MAKHRYGFDEDKIQRYQAEGRGQGAGADYVPWLHIQDVPSKGRVHRAVGVKTTRMQEFMSDLEWYLFLLYDWLSLIVDIREQYPMDRDITREIAKTAGIQHPRDPITKTDIVMTSDFFLIFNNRGVQVPIVRTAKYAKDLENRRNIEKLEIERRYYERLDIDWGVVTEKELPRDLIGNLDWLRGSSSLESVSEPYEGFHQEKLSAFGRALSLASGQSLVDFCSDFDASHNVTAGTGLFLAKHLLATGQIQTDLEVPNIRQCDVSKFCVTDARPSLRLRAA